MWMSQGGLKRKPTRGNKGDGISLALKEVEFGSLKSQKVVVGRRLLKVGRGRML